MAAVGRVSAVIGAAGGVTVEQHERTVGAAIGAGLLGSSLLVARFPRLLAWPIAAAGALFGGANLARAVRPQAAQSPPPAAPRWQRRGKRWPRQARPLSASGNHGAKDRAQRDGEETLVNEPAD